MSKYKLIAVAVAAALASPAAFATSVTGDVTVLPQNVFVDDAVAAENAETLTVLANATSVYLGRTTGYNIRLTLSQGEFYVDPVATAAGNIAAVAVAGGGDGANTVTFAVTPDAVDGVVEGDGISFAAGSLVVEGADLVNGGSISVAVQVFDPVGGNQLGSTVNAELIRTAEGWVVDYNGGPDGQRIDVGANSQKRYFGTAAVNSGDPATTFNAGQIEVGTSDALSHPYGLDPATATAGISLEGSFAPFVLDTDSGIYLSTAPTCDATGAIYATIAQDGASATFPAASTVNDVNGRYLCFLPNGDDAIDRQQVIATTVVSQATAFFPGAGTSHPTADSPAFGSSDTLTEMRYNGTVVRVDHFNPASNPGQQSYLRVINPSNTVGLVSVEAICQDGSAAPGIATFTLAPGASRQVNSGDLEAGGNGIDGSVGACGGGKSRLIVTGEFANMGVQNFLRNSLQGTVVNTHINNVTDEESKDN